jgi:ATP phosphoribosyltransferase
VYNVHGESWYAVSLVVARNSLLEVVDHLRGVGASEVSTSPVGYMFKGSSSAYQSLLSRL